MNWRKAKKAVKKEFQINRWPGAISPRHLRNICISVQDNVRPLVLQQVRKVKGLPEDLLPLAVQQCTPWATGMIVAETLARLHRALLDGEPIAYEESETPAWKMPATAYAVAEQEGNDE